jgi:hypothetical protein
MPLPALVTVRRHTAGTVARRRVLLSIATLAVGCGVLVQADTASAAVTTATFNPAADARVLQSNPTTNYGSVTRLDVDEPGEQSYLRFTVTGVVGTVQGAKLRLFVRNGSSNAPSLYFTSNTWTESTITWNNRPAPIGAAIADVGASPSGTWSEYDLTGDITGNGTYDLVALPDDDDGIQWDSRENSSPPQLVLTVDDGGGGGGGGGPTNAPPVANDDSATTTAGTAVTIDVAANDTDPDGNLAPGSATTSCTGCTTPQHGTLVANGSGTFGYTPAAGYTGPDGFTYRICDTQNACDTAVVTITVNPSGPVGGPATLAPVADARVLQSDPTTNYGSVKRLDVDSPGEQSYLRFTVAGVGAVQSAKLRLFVRNGSSNAPSLYFTSNAWTESTITWNNRPAPIGAAIADVTTATSGTWSEYDLTGDITGDGTYDLVLVADGSDGVQYDSREGSSPPQLVLNGDGGGGGPTNAPPVANDDSAATTAGFAVTINVAANDTDPDGNLVPGSATTTCTGCTTPQHGPLVANGNGTFGYTPAAGYTGPDGFTYQICDSQNACDTAVVTITVSPVGTGSAVLVGAGDIADCGRTTDDATANLLDGIPGTVFTVGDNSYPASATGFANCYSPTWGRHKARTRPAIGDNEYDSSGAAPYFAYFGAVAGDPTKGWYSYDLGTWHVIHLNSNCSKVGGCKASSPQGQWLQADLAAHPAQCIVAIEHEPLFSSKGGDSDIRDFWTPLYAAGADIIVSGHRHNYERFAPQTPTGVATANGIRQFVVGTGGTSLSSFGSSVAANSQVRNDKTHGVLKLTLHPTSYDWEFVPIAGQTFTDSGSSSCVG